MECRLRKIKGNWHAAFKYGGHEFTHSLRTKNEKEAEVRLGLIRDTLYRLENGTFAMLPGADVKAFIVSGGQQATRPTHVSTLTVGAVADVYLAAVESIEANTKKTKTIHLNHMRRLLGQGTPLDTIRQSDVQSYAKARRKEKFQGKQTEGYTIRKELRTFRQVWEWACSQGYPTVAPTWTVEAVDLPKDQGREPFRTFDQIQQIVTRGGLSAKDEARHWETLFLNGGELQDLLAYVQENATASWVYPMVSFVALTGCRRSEAVTLPNSTIGTSPQGTFAFVKEAGHD